MSDALRKLMFATDLGVGCGAVYAHAARLAAGSGARLRVLHVRGRADAPGWERLDPLPWADGVEEDRESVVSEVPVHGVILDIAAQRPDMLVLGTRRRRGVRRLREGSVSESLARRSGVVSLFVGHGCDPIVDPGSGSVDLARILMPVEDDSPEQQRALEVAVYVARTLGARGVEVVLLHCGESVPALARPAADGWSWTERTSDEAVVPAILAAAHELRIDLIAMATRGDDGLLDLLFGSKTEQVIRQAPCPVLAVPTG